MMEIRELQQMLNCERVLNSEDVSIFIKKVEASFNNSANWKQEVNALRF